MFLYEGGWIPSVLGEKEVQVVLKVFLEVFVPVWTQRQRVLRKERLQGPLLCHMSFQPSLLKRRFTLQPYTNALPLSVCISFC